MQKNLIAVSIFSLAIAIIVGSLFISDGLNNSETQMVNEEKNGETTQEKQLLTQTELRNYLGITEEELSMILPSQEGNVTTSEIPYIRLGNKFYFSVKAIDKWLLETEVVTISR